jgi:hypothetical protein
MTWYAKLDAIKGNTKGKDSTSDTFMFAEKYAANGDETPARTRLFVGNPSMNSSDQRSEIDNEVLVDFEHSKGPLPDCGRLTRFFCSRRRQP